MNQRMRTRVSARKEVSLECRSGPLQGELVNVSLKGCLVQLSGGTAVPTGEALSLVIYLEPEAPELVIRVQGRAVRTKNGALAVEFTEVELESFQHLFRLVQYNAEEPDEIEEELGTSAFCPPADLDA